MPDVKKISSTENLGLAIRSRRKQLGLSLHDVANFTNLGVRFISEVERGKSTAEIGKVIELCNSVGIDIFVGER
jgi:transcriptional regulator with XRE-family HTH domain